MNFMYRSINLAYVLKVSEPKMYVMNDETLEGLSTSLRYTKWPSALAYDEMNNEMMK